MPRTEPTQSLVVSCAFPNCGWSHTYQVYDPEEPLTPEEPKSCPRCGHVPLDYTVNRWPLRVPPLPRFNRHGAKQEKMDDYLARLAAEPAYLDADDANGDYPHRAADPADDHQPVDG